MHDPTSVIDMYDPWLVTLAGGFAFFAALGVFRLRARMGHAKPAVQAAWVFLSASIGGGGIWAAQFLALTSMRLCVGAGCEPLGVIVALLVSVPLIAGALGVAWSGADRSRPISGGLLLSLAIAATRWVALKAYIVQGAVTWEPARLWLAIAGGATLCALALHLAGRARTSRSQLAGAVVLTLAMAAMHIGATWAMNVSPSSVAHGVARGLDCRLVAIPVVLIALLMILGGLGAAFIDTAASHTASLRMRRLADASRDGIAVVRSDGRIIDCNAAFASLVQRDVAALVGRPLVGALLHLDVGGLIPGEISTGSLRADDGEAIPVKVTSRSLASDEAPERKAIAVTLQDLREQQAVEQQVRYLARHDLVTGLPNRGALQDELTQGVARHRDGGPAIMLTFLTVSNSKEINEAYGTDAGDALLLKVAERLKRFAGATGFAARQGGAEFAWIGYGDSNEVEFAAAVELARAVTTQLDRVLRRPFDHHGLRIEPRVLIGVTGTVHESDDAQAMFAQAESALDRAKRSGEPICFFRAEFHAAQKERHRLAAELASAIKDDQLVLFYQPQSEALSGVITGFEALVRWRHPEKGLIAPDKFIPIAEAEGLIGALGEWVLRRACLDAASWIAPLSVAVNLSALQIGEIELPKRVHEILLETGLAPARLELEVTESALFGDQQRALDVLRRLKALGLSISMDDFGTGYSSLSSLHSFPFDKIKIDRSFVDGIGKLERSTVLVRAVLGIGRGLGVPVIAEGVETPEQLAFLCAEKCASIQGYLIGKPAPIETFASTVHAPAPAEGHPSRRNQRLPRAQPAA